MTKETWAWFKGFTTISGLGQTFASTEKQWKGFWGFLTLGLISLTGYSVIQTLAEYFAFDVTTSFTIDHAHGLDIPSVTICNVNRVHCGNLFDKIKTYANENNVSLFLLPFHFFNNLSIICQSYFSLLRKDFVNFFCSLDVTLAFKWLKKLSMGK